MALDVTTMAVIQSNAKRIALNLRRKRRAKVIPELITDALGVLLLSPKRNRVNTV